MPDTRALIAPWYNDDGSAGCALPEGQHTFGNWCLRYRKTASTSMPLAIWNINQPTGAHASYSSQQKLGFTLWLSSSGNAIYSTVTGHCRKIGRESHHTTLHAVHSSWEAQPPATVEQSCHFGDWGSQAEFLPRPSDHEILINSSPIEEPELDSVTSWRGPDLLPDHARRREQM